MPALPIDTNQIVITASRVPQQEAQTPASVTIIDQQRIKRLDEPLVSTLLRLTPSVAVATSGPAGSFTEVRIRGAENNHTLLFIDGIRANDPASGDFARFELLNADIASRIEVLRGPQSALWGSDAIGGVIAVNGTNDHAGYAAAAEAGSYGFARGSGSAAISSGETLLAGAVGWQRATGIDSFGAPGGDRDGYHNLAARLRALAALTPNVRLGAAGFALSGYSEFDGYDPVTFARTDTLDNSRNQLDAGRVWVEYGSKASLLKGHIGASLLNSSNRNFLADTPVNRTSGTRRTVDAQVERQFSAGALDQTLILAAETERETFHARGQSSGLSTDQDRGRRHSALTAEWRAKGGPVVADVALRRDFFDRFKDATTFRASALADVGRGFALAGSFAEGMAQPTFFDLYGTFPNNFIGNPSLEPETSRGFEGSLRFRRSTVSASMTAYRQRLRHEIVDVFNPATFLLSTANSDQVSNRWGVEAEIGWQIKPHLRLSGNYSFLHATQPDTISGRQVRELRRPKHSGAVVADGSSGPWSYGASIAYAGSHLDVLEVPPFGIARVKPYWLAGGRVAYTIRPGVELFARGSNLLGANYQEVAGYHTEGRAMFAGIRLADRRSSP
ncbi:TonB-dependent receptor plug domain-containing protein [Sphingomonas sp.]|uniref:TonB-dependent receptor plug domain-containing protein n=1 Tax=Sphingomonas sp. TaxID=28214 RepID=UPI0038B1DE42